MQPMIARSLVNSLLITAGLLEPQLRQHRFSPTEFDLLCLPYTKRVGDVRPRDPNRVSVIVAHVTDVRGGFGVSPKRVDFWRRQIENDTLPQAIIDALAPAEWTGPPVQCARRVALWERYRRLPYHQIGGSNGDNCRNQVIHNRTYHAGLGNGGVGWALDVGHDQEIEEWHIATGRAALTSLADRLLRESSRAREDGIVIVPHRVYSANRRIDTDARVWREIVKPVCQQLAPTHGTRIDYTIQVGKGLPVPRSWDDDALFDHRGRRV